MVPAPLPGRRDAIVVVKGDQRMHIKIRGGTVNHGEASLCSTCRFTTIIRGQRLRDEIVECSRLSDRGTIPFCVSSCTAYSDASARLDL
jgi:hypothetical protein